MVSAIQIIGFIKFCLPIPLFLVLVMSIVLLFKSLENNDRDLLCSPLVSLTGIILILLVSTIIPGSATQIMDVLFGCFVV